MRKINLKSTNSFLLILILVIVLAGCNRNRKFDSEHWKQKGIDWQITDFRESMVEDLIQSNTLIGLNKSEIIELLSEPEKSDNRVIWYLIREKYESNIDPEYISYLRIELDSNMIAMKCRIEK